MINAKDDLNNKTPHVSHNSTVSNVNAFFVKKRPI
jgi:hypothetical protein